MPANRIAYHAGEHLNVNTTWWEMVKTLGGLYQQVFLFIAAEILLGMFVFITETRHWNRVPPDRIDPNITPLYDDDPLPSLRAAQNN
ncbi:MAG: hypothetical protein IPI77_16335 [Saprospiraceae bacterium]|nr:hypothetical protein [Saprospiraceae bacterium]